MIKKQTIDLEQWESDILLGCRSWYNIDGESNINKLKRVCINITGCSKDEIDDFPYSAVISWMWRVYSKLLLLPQSGVTTDNLQEYMCGTSWFFNTTLIMKEPLLFFFLYSQIGNCRANNLDINFNKELGLPDSYEKFMKLITERG